jgi:glycosyltransferase involved in cell wall biosynthesis
VSVLLPVRDAAATLDACLDSLAAQTLGEHEVIAVDDGSADGSGERLRERAARDARLSVIQTPPHGIVAALNLALGEARASVLARMDADDVAHPERLQLQLERLERDPSVDVVSSRVDGIGASGEAPGAGMCAYVEWVNGLATHDEMERSRFVEAPVVHPSVALRTATLRALTGYRDFDGPEDYDLWLRAFATGRRFAKLDASLLGWRDSPGRLTRRDARYAARAFARLKAEALARGPLVGRPAVVWGAGPVGKAFARALVVAGQRIAAFVEVDPRKIGQRIYGVPVVGVAAARGQGEALHLGAVGRPGARERIRTEAAQLGLVDGRDFLAVA